MAFRLSTNQRTSRQCIIASIRTVFLSVQRASCGDRRRDIDVAGIHSAWGIGIPLRERPDTIA